MYVVAVTTIILPRANNFSIKVIRRVDHNLPQMKLKFGANIK